MRKKTKENLPYVKGHQPLPFSTIRFTVTLFIKETVNKTGEWKKQKKEYRLGKPTKKLCTKCGKKQMVNKLTK